MYLNGWQRLWVFLSVIYLVPVIFVAADKYPAPKDIYHFDGLYDRMDPNLKKKLDLDRKRKYFLDAFSGKELPDYPKGKKDKGQRFKSSNNHLLFFKLNITDEEVEQVSKEYWGVVEEEAKRRQQKIVLAACLFWLGPVLLAYILGLSVVWVYKGFRKL